MVFTKHITEEIAYKERELGILEERILDTKVQLHRIRLVLLSQEYGLNVVNSGSEPTVGRTSASGSIQDELTVKPGTGGSWDEFEQRFLSAHSSIGSSQSQAASSMGTPLSSKSHSCEPSEQDKNSDEEGDGDEDGSDVSSPIVSAAVFKENFDIDFSELEHELSSTQQNVVDSSLTLSTTSLEPTCQTTHFSSGPSQVNESRFYTKRRVIVGNTSQYMAKSLRFSTDSSHKWMVYVRGPPGDQPIHTYVKAVRFFLHPSYRPHHIVQVNSPPFNLTRFGWGEFPVRVQLLFHNSRHKPIDIIHNLKLDRTRTGQQMLGAETLVDIELERGDVGNVSKANFPGVSRLEREQLPLDDTSTEEFFQDEGDLQNGNQAPVGKECTPTHGSHNTNQLSSDIHGDDPHTRCTPIVASQTVHHITIPISDPSDAILLDHDYSMQVVVKRASDHLPKAQQGLLPYVSPAQPSSCFTSIPGTALPTDSYLHFAASLLPLYAPLNLEACPFAADSLNEYRTWSLPKQRANEWMRAVAVKKLALLRMSQCLGGGSEHTLTTRYVVLWCRRNGFTPLDPAMVSSPGFCKYCGHQLPPCKSSVALGKVVLNYHIECEEAFTESGGFSQLNSYSSPFELLKLVESEVDNALSGEEDDQEIDIETNFLDITQSKPQDSSPVIIRQPATPELRWVQLTTAQVGIRLSPILHLGKVLHVVEHMVYAACSHFLKDLLRAAVHVSLSSPASTKDNVMQNSEDLRQRVILPLHVYRAIKQHENMDFLTNEGLALSCLHK